MANSANDAASSGIPVRRRDFLRVGVAGAAALAVSAPEVSAGQAAETQDHVVKPTPPPEGDPKPSADFQSYERTGGDFMADVIKSLPIDYVCSNPADKCAGLQESLTGPYGGNKSPEWITCTHEEISVAMGHGYYKIENRMLAMAGHSTVGLMHAALAVYNAYCDRAPVYLIFGNSQIPTNHAAIDISSPIRDFIRWYTNPLSLAVVVAMEEALRLVAVQWDVGRVQIEHDPGPLPPEAMAMFIRKDNGMMPPFSSKLVPDKDVADIVAFLRPVATPTDIKNIPDFKKQGSGFHSALTTSTPISIGGANSTCQGCGLVMAQSTTGNRKCHCGTKS